LRERTVNRRCRTEPFLRGPVRQTPGMRELGSWYVLPCMLAVAGFAFDLAAYYPGQVSFDSAYTWWQARGGETTDTQAPVFMYVWRLCSAILPAPGSVFVLQLSLFWGGLLLVVVGLRLGPFAGAFLLLLVGVAPVAMILRAHVWTDVSLTGALLVVTGLLSLCRRTARRGWLLLAVPFGLYAVGLRHNALPAALPLIVYGVQQFLVAGGSVVTYSRLALGSGFVVVALFGAAQAINASVDRHAPMWPVLAQFDLAALSIAANEVLLPRDAVGAGMDVPDLEQAHRSWGVNALLSNTKHGIRDPHTPPWTAAELDGLRRAWVAAIIAHPRAYVAHRLDVSAGLFGTHPREWPRDLIFVDADVQFKDNPAIAANRSALHRALGTAADALRDTPALAAWPYLALGLLVAPLAWRDRERPPARTAGILLASALLYAAPLLVVAPSADLRYLLWPCVAALAAAALVVQSIVDRGQRGRIERRDDGPAGPNARR
jgi:hypothetical protein